MIRQMSMDAYSFSISWSRVIPRKNLMFLLKFIRDNFY